MLILRYLYELIITQWFINISGEKQKKGTSCTQKVMMHLW